MKGRPSEGEKGRVVKYEMGKRRRNNDGETEYDGGTERTKMRGRGGEWANGTPNEKEEMEY